MCSLSWETFQVSTWNYLSGPLELLLSWTSVPLPPLGMVTTRAGLGKGGGWVLPLILLMVGLITDRVCGWVVWATVG